MKSLLLNAHRYQKDCACPRCADHRTDLKLAVIHDYIKWANAPLLAGMQRASDARLKPEGVDVPVEVLQAAGVRVLKCQRSFKAFRLTEHARA